MSAGDIGGAGSTGRSASMSPGEIMAEQYMALEVLSYALLGGRLGGDDPQAVADRAIVAARTATAGVVLDWAVELHDMIADRMRAGASLWDAVHAVRIDPRGCALFHQLDAVRRAAVEDDA